MRHFEQQLQELLQKIVLMASMVESMIGTTGRRSASNVNVVGSSAAAK